MINFRLKENKLTADENDYTAVVQHLETLQIEDLARLIVAEGSESNELTIVDLFKKMERMIVKQLAAGKKVNTTLLHAMTVISGRFDGETAAFDPAKGHKLEVAINISQATLQAIAEGNQLVNIGALPTGPVIGTVLDLFTRQEVKSHTENVITPQRGLRIKGEGLRIASDEIGTHATDCGVWFVPTGDSGTPIRVPDPDVTRNQPSEVEIITPALPAGTYWLEIVTQSTGRGKELVKEPRTVRFKTPVKIETP